MQNNIQKYITQNASSTYITRGKSIFRNSDVDVLDIDWEGGSAKFTVNSQSSDDYYNVTITDFNDSSNMDAECDCPVGGLCKHGVAALLTLEKKMIEKNGVSTNTPASNAKPKDTATEDTLLTQATSLFELAKTIENKKNTTTPAPKAKNTGAQSAQVSEDFPQPSNIKRLSIKTFSESHLLNTLPKYANKFAPDLLKKGNLSYQILAPRKIIGEVLDAVSDPKSQPIQHKMYVYKEYSGYQYKEYHVACTCGATTLCSHVVALLVKIHREWGDNGIDEVQNFENEKNALLAAYGYTIKDDLDNKFAFKVTKGYYNYRNSSHNYNVELVLLDKSIIKIDEFGKKVENFLPVAQISAAEREFKPNALKNKATIDTKEDNEFYTYVIVPTATSYGVDIYYIMARYDAKRTRILTEAQVKIRPNTDFSLESYKKLDENSFELLEIANKLSAQGIRTLLNSLGDRSYPNNWIFTSTSHANRLTIYNYIKRNVQQLYDVFPDNGMMCLSGSVQINYSNAMRISNFITPTTHRNTALNLRFRTREDGDFLVFEGEVYGENIACPIHSPRANFGIPFTVVIDKDWYLLDLSAEQMTWLVVFLQYKQIKVRKTMVHGIVKSMLIPMSRFFEIDSDLIEATKTVAPIGIRQLYLKEIASENIIIFHPIIQYDKIQVELNDEPTHFYLGDNEELIIERDLEFETEFKSFLEGLHPNFEVQEFYTANGCFFWLTINEMLEKAWFLDFFQALSKNGIELFGFNKLKKFKFNANKAEFTMHTSSGIDWFDLQGEMSFGDQVASLRDIQKALFKKQNYVQLTDGTLGLLPEEWIEKYGALLRIGNIKGNNLQVSKLHFTLLDQLYEDIDQEAILQELTEKREKLRNFTNITQTSTPNGIEATLRPYQKEGFNWLNFLHDFTWGGILADDMGLGKTLQIITFLQHQANLADANAQPRKTHLIIAPTSLIFNWESEVEKFAPTLKTLIYHGAARKNIGVLDFETVDMVITTYTTAASDIEKFKNFRFGYAVLDESQAIKNATTQRYKAMRLLQADNRICMSGTPVENNTFDLYGQFNFLNPGMLGSMEYFKEQYATPIDRDNDSEKSQELRRLVQPFMLRRTKELVAADLPEKTEIVLYCEMGSKQRKLYDAYREKVRKQVLGEIDAKGLSSAAMIVLQGLLRLRQICDSPNLISDDEVTEFEEESIKLQELKEHISERTGNHKILIFSQFKGMLALIRNMLEHAKIPFLYLDGGTSPTDRRTAVDKFQTDERYRVFLISLKAGGSGLNLTAADYVYLVDPWWNPAVEQQAIDRTHRIGQTNHVFAYKMICKDTVEEKILKLQEKKKALAADLVASETGMMKSLTRDDIAFLFS